MRRARLRSSHGAREQTDRMVASRLQSSRCAYANIKSEDTVVAGMWQKHRDEIAMNVGHALNALGLSASLGSALR